MWYGLHLVDNVWKYIDGSVPTSEDIHWAKSEGTGSDVVGFWFSGISWDYDLLSGGWTTDVKQRALCEFRC